MGSDSIHVSRQGEAWVVELHGEHDLSTAPVLVDALRRVNGVRSRVVVDLTVAEFIDSTVLAALIGAGQHVAGTGGRIAVVAPAGGNPRRLLDLVRLDRPALRIVETRADALRLLTGAC